MKTIIATINDIKAISDLINANDALKENSYQVDGYSYSYGGKENLIEAKELEISKNIKAIATILDVHYNDVVEMCYNLEFAQYVLNDIYSN